MADIKLVPYAIKSIHSKQIESYGIAQLAAQDLWEEAEKGKGIVVAVIDTGIDQDHPALKDRIIDGRNFTDEGHAEDFSDHNGHGTHVAGIVNQMSPNADLLICKVLGSNGGGSYKGIIHGIQWATQWKGANGEKVRVMNMSLGGSHNDPELYKAILEACAKGILIVVASGNENDPQHESDFEISYPALYNECITVAACDQNEKLAGFSNEHLQVDVIASGVDISSTYLNGSYAVLSGTSMAAPHVTGALALIIKAGEKEFKRVLTESEIYALLIKCCCSLGYHKSSEGNGIPDLSKLMEHCKRS